MLLVLAACTPPPQQPEPISTEASYRLLFNGNLVGQALFALQIGPDGNYRIDTFTVPAGQMQQAVGHEVLESSQGTIGDKGIRPRRFKHSVMQGERVETFSFVFDWEKHILQLVGADSERKVGLLPDTHDRLSYLLVAQRLAVAAQGASTLQIASPESATEAHLEVIGKRTITTPFGQLNATGIRRTGAESDEVRELWFAPEAGPLPIQVKHSRDENEVEMQLESLSRPPGHPR